jgi:hypothetical protein
MQKILYTLYYRLIHPIIKLLFRLITQKSEIVRLSEKQDTLNLSNDFNNNKEKSI